jgi:RNA polymerase sigma factor (sigma-70 family)
VVYGIARNLYRKHVERCTAQKRQKLDAADVITACDDQPIEHREVREAVAKLPRDTGKVISLRYLQERTLRECCDATGLTMQNVRTLEAKGLAQLREMLLA